MLCSVLPDGHRVVGDGEQFIAGQEAQRVRDPRALLEGYFDFHYRHRADLLMIVAELSTLAELGLVDRLLAWRDRLGKLVFGPRPTLAQATRAVIAFGGLQDCCLQFPDTPERALRTAAVAGAIAALGLPGKD